jgi:hypothetical protein
MPDFGDLEKEAESHSQQVDEGIGKVEQEGDKEADGRDHGMIDKGGAELEKEIGQ